MSKVLESIESFKNKHSCEERLEESKKVLEKYPDRVPIIVEKAKNTKICDIDKHKFLVPNDITVGQFTYIIRKRIELEPETAMFVFVNNILPPTACCICEIYEEHKSEDGFLYFTYSGENTFG